jgi:uncharacterized repeat protein (TIGR03899 family)
MTRIHSLSAAEQLRHLARHQLGQKRTYTEQERSPLPNAESKSPQISSQAQQALLWQQLGLHVHPWSDISQRAQLRQQQRLEQQQQNLEHILKLAEPYCMNQIPEQALDLDWFQHFCDLAQDISSQAMQKLWARILAAELNKPFSFSYRTMQVLKQMSYHDAMQFQLAASYSCRSKLQDGYQIYFGYHGRLSVWQWLRGKQKAQLNLSQYGLTYPQILNLIDIGLLHQAEIESGRLAKNSEFQLQYQQLQLKGQLKVDGIALQYYKFTRSGTELFPLLNLQPQPAYWLGLQHLLSDIMRVD